MSSTYVCYSMCSLSSVSSSSSSSSVICQTTGPKPLPKRFLDIVRSRVSSFNWQYPLLSLRSSSSFLRLLPHLLVTSICPFIFPSITCCRRQFLRKMWPIQWNLNAFTNFLLCGSHLYISLGFCFTVFLCCVRLQKHWYEYAGHKDWSNCASTGTAWRPG